MFVLICGLLMFFSVHSWPMVPRLRRRLVGIAGENGYKLLFSALSVIGLALIVIGYGEARTLGRANPQLWVPPNWTRHLVYLLMLPAIILLVAAYVPARIRDRARHPMLAAIKIWALAHLLVRGDLASLLLFGSFLAYGVVDRISVKRRDAPGPLGSRAGTARGDAIVVAIGLAAYALTIGWLHGWLIGIPLMGLRVAP